MFVYCGNNPVISADQNGEWFILVVGAVAGAATGALSTLVQQYTDRDENGEWQYNGDEILVSAICGAFSGVLGAAGVGGVAGQMLAGALSSAVDSGYQNYNEYVNGGKTMEEAIVGTLVDTAMGATFGAMGFDKPNALNASDVISVQTIDALRTLTKSGLNPLVKKAAKSALRSGQKYITNELKSALLDNALTGVFGYGVGSVTEMLY